jgi:hypothetical protein
VSGEDSALFLPAGRGMITGMNNPEQPQPLAPAAVRRPALFTPMLLSALVYPGTGQLLQRRWVAAAGYAIAFTGPMVWFVVEDTRILKAYYEFMLDFKGATGEIPAIGSIIVPLLLSMAVYVAGLVDTAVAAYRLRMKARTLPTS